MNVTQEQLQDMENTLRDALGTAAQTVRPEAIRGLHDQRPGQTGKTGGPGGGRRRRAVRTLVPLAAAASVALIAVLVSVVIPGALRGHRGGSAAPGAAGPARFFLALKSDSDQFAVYAAATGRLAAQIPVPHRGGHALAAYVAAATGSDRTFVVAAVGASCGTTELYRLRLTGQGRPEGLTPLGVPAIQGTVTAMAASADGSVIGYATQFCNASAASPGAIGVIHAGGGLSRQWTWPGPGQSVTSLSMTADGSLIEYAGQPNKVTGPGSGELLPVRNVRVLPTDAPPGSAAERSRVLLPVSPRSLPGAFDAAAISANGRALYLCTQASFTHPAQGGSELRSYFIPTTGPINMTDVMLKFGRGSAGCLLGLSGNVLLAGLAESGDGSRPDLVKYDLATEKSAAVPVPSQWDETTTSIPW